MAIERQDNGGFAGIGFDHLVSVILQSLGEGPTDGRVVVCDEDDLLLAFHGVHSVSREHSHNTEILANLDKNPGKTG